MRKTFNYKTQCGIYFLVNNCGHNNVGFNTMKFTVIDGKYLMLNSMVVYLILFNGIYLMGGDILK